MGISWRQCPWRPFFFVFTNRSYISCPRNFPRYSGIHPCYNQDLLIYGVCGADVNTAVIDGRLVMREVRKLAEAVKSLP